MNMWTKYARLAIALPLLAFPLFASSASAAAGPTTITGSGLSVTFPGPNTRIGVVVTVPIQVVCSPLQSAFFGSFGNGHLSLVQATPSGKAAVGAGDVFWFINGTQGGGKGGGGGPGFSFMSLTCDSRTVNAGTLTVIPDTFTDPFTGALHNGPADASFSGQVCSFSYFGANCDSAGPASFATMIRS
jgi:hypothetical protein